jgi:PIN domain nuclease of toxin-antitoxin system
METDDPVVLDTHIWVWLMEGDPRLPDSVVGMLEEASGDNRVLVSSVSIWEIVALESAGRVVFSMPVLEWLTEATYTPGLSVIPLDASIAVEAAHLPGSFSGDSPDRVIAASARVRSGVLVTADPRMIQYGDAGHVRVAPVGA